MNTAPAALASPPPAVAKIGGVPTSFDERRGNLSQLLGYGGVRRFQTLRIAYARSGIFRPAPIEKIVGSL